MPIGWVRPVLRTVVTWRFGSSTSTGIVSARIGDRPADEDEDSAAATVRRRTNE